MISVCGPVRRPNAEPKEMSSKCPFKSMKKTPVSRRPRQRQAAKGGLRALHTRVRATRPAAREVARSIRHGQFPRLGSRRAVGEDIKFDMKHFADIERLAMVGDKKWQQGMAAFCKPFTKATIRYLDHAEADEARKWLSD